MPVMFIVISVTQAEVKNKLQTVVMIIKWLYIVDIVLYCC